MERFKYKPTEIACIGDQLITDVLGANRMDFTSVLVHPLSSRDHTVTLFNRICESFIFSSLERKDLFKKGKYYD